MLFNLCFGLNVYIFPNSHIEALFLSVMPFEGVLVFGAFGKSLDHKGEALVNEISAIRQTL